MLEATQITFQAAFDLYQKQAGALDELWKFYATVALALLSATVASDKLKATSTGVAVIVIGFLFFAVANLAVILNVHETMISLADLTNGLARASPTTQNVVLKSSTQLQVAFSHVVVDLAFIVAMIVIYRSSHQHKTNA